VHVLDTGVDASSGKLFLFKCLKERISTSRDLMKISKIIYLMCCEDYSMSEDDDQNNLRVSAKSHQLVESGEVEIAFSRCGLSVQPRTLTGFAIRARSVFPDSLPKAVMSSKFLADLQDAGEKSLQGVCELLMLDNGTVLLRHNSEVVLPPILSISIFCRDVELEGSPLLFSTILKDAGK
jgi:hypothetical protein